MTDKQTNLLLENPYERKLWHEVNRGNSYFLERNDRILVYGNVDNWGDLTTREYEWGRIAQKIKSQCDIYYQPIIDHLKEENAHLRVDNKTKLFELDTARKRIAELGKRE